MELQFPEFPFMYVSGWGEPPERFFDEIWGQKQNSSHSVAHTFLLIWWLSSLFRGSPQAGKCPTIPQTLSSSNYSTRWVFSSCRIPTRSKSEAMWTAVVSVHPCGFQLVLVELGISSSFPLFWIESCPPSNSKVDILKSLSPVPQKLTLLGNKVFTKVIKLKRGR